MFVSAQCGFLLRGSASVLQCKYAIAAVDVEDKVVARKQSYIVCALHMHTPICLLKQYNRTYFLLVSEMLPELVFTQLPSFMKKI